MNDESIIMGESPRPKSTSPVTTPSMDFPGAVQQMIDGKMITSLSWNDKNEYGLMKDGWLMIHHAAGTFHVWKVSEADMTLNDWIVIQGN